MAGYTEKERELIRDTEHAMLPVGTTREIEGRQFVYVGREVGWLLMGVRPVMDFRDLLKEVKIGSHD